MIVRVYSKDVSPGVEVGDSFRKECGFKWQLEDGIEMHIKRDMKLC